MIMFLAGLQTVPEQLLRAARVDGANAWKRFWHVTVPHSSTSGLVSSPSSPALSPASMDAPMSQSGSTSTSHAFTFSMEKPRQPYWRHSEGLSSLFPLRAWDSSICLQTCRRWLFLSAHGSRGVIADCLQLLGEAKLSVIIPILNQMRSNR
jgi:hypothetical protein